MDFLMGFVHFALDAIAILLLMATWQHSRVTGFLALAGSYALGIVGRWGIVLLYRFFDPAASFGVAWIYQLFWLAASALALYGLWDIYRYFRSARTSPPPAV